MNFYLRKLRLFLVVWHTNEHLERISLWLVGWKCNLNAPHDQRNAFQLNILVDNPSNLIVRKPNFRCHRRTEFVTKLEDSEIFFADFQMSQSYGENEILLIDF